MVFMRTGGDVSQVLESHFVVAPRLYDFDLIAANDSNLEDPSKQTVNISTEYV